MLCRSFVTVLALVVLVGQVGCSLKAPISPEEKREQLGRIGLVSARFTPEPELAATKGRLRGAAKGIVGGVGLGGGLALGGAAACAGGGPVAGICMAAMLAVGGATSIVAGVVGGIAGTVNAIPAEEAEGIEANLKQLVDLKFQETLRERLFEVARQETSLHFALVDEGGPNGPEENVSYVHLRDSGIDTILETRLHSLGFKGGGGSDPELSLFMRASARLVDVKSGIELRRGTFRYASPKQEYSVWMTNEGRAIRNELPRGFTVLAEKIVKELFVLAKFNPRRTPLEKDSGEDVPQSELEREQNPAESLTSDKTA